MPMRVRQHVNPLHVQFATFRGAVPELEPGRPVEVEIGCAEAQFLFERAAQEPDRTYLGLEIREELVHWVNREEIGKSVVEESVLPADTNPGTPPAQPPANGEEKPK